MAGQLFGKCLLVIVYLCSQGFREEDPFEDGTPSGIQTQNLFQKTEIRASEYG